jgi:hypothetical protein
MFKPLIAISALVVASLAMAQTAQPLRLRATIEKVEPGSITVKERSGEVVTLLLASDLSVTEVYPISIDDIKADSYVGAAATPGKDGTLDAVEVHVFPAAMRGAGEGHRPFDLMPQATMTNAAVVGMSSSASGRTLKLKYKDGEKILNVPLNVPIVSFKPGDNALLVTGAKLIVTAEVRDGKPTATRISAGRNGFAPPM